MKDNLILVIHDTDKDLISVHYLLKSIILKLKQKYKKNILIKNIHNESLNDIPLSKIKTTYVLNLKSFNNNKFKNLLPSLSNNSSLNIFIMGDFTKRINLLIEEEGNLLRLKTKFITLGKTYSKFIKPYLNPMNQIEEFKISVSSNFKKTSHLKMQLRKKLRIQKDDIVLIYTGRISTQKNVLSLIKAFNLAQKNYPNLKLLLVGPFDYFENPAFHLEAHLKTLEFPPLIFQESYKNNSIVFKPLTNEKKLNQYLNASDYYINLSTYHDEDFGLSPREAEKIKLPTFTSDWGGFKELNSVKISPSIILNDPKKLANQIVKFVAKKYKNNKVKIEKSYQQSNKIYFQGFSDQAKMLCISQLSNNPDEKLYNYFYKTMGAKDFNISNKTSSLEKIIFPIKVNSGYFISKRKTAVKVKTVVLINTTKSQAKKILQRDEQGITFINFDDLNKMPSLRHQFSFNDWLIVADGNLSSTKIESRMLNHILANGTSIFYLKPPQNLIKMCSLELSPNHCLFYF